MQLSKMLIESTSIINIKPYMNWIESNCYRIGIENVDYKRVRLFGWSITQSFSVHYCERILIQDYQIYHRRSHPGTPEDRAHAGCQGPEGPLDSEQSSLPNKKQKIWRLSLWYNMHAKRLRITAAKQKKLFFILMLQ